MLATVLLSHAGDGAAEVTWPRRDVDVESCWRRHCRGDLAVMRCRCRVMLTMVLPSHIDYGAVEAIWLRHDVDAEPCWQWCCWDDLIATRWRCRVMLRRRCRGDLTVA
jgi:hypothetical protein